MFMENLLPGKLYFMTQKNNTNFSVRHPGTCLTIVPNTKTWYPGRDPDLFFHDSRTSCYAPHMP
ncbi:MAG: hypothetical protein A2018_02700 [Alphaproteobacteria bacterium GWF2_58_20]|nr:MAG: hypothetical protein A2018_02700 [Alphaproteobacteria bacterium GWF2_58_20]